MLKNWLNSIGKTDWQTGDKSNRKLRWREEGDRQQATRQEEERQQKLIVESGKSELWSFKSIIKNATVKATENKKECIDAGDRDAF